jgi:prevent-host-death family protein
MSELQVGIRELKSRLSHYIRHVKSGQTVTITEYGKPVGQIIPITEEQSLEDRLKAMQEAGLLEWNGQKLEPTPRQARTKGDRTVADLLLEDRG